MSEPYRHTAPGSDLHDLERILLAAQVGFSVDRQGDVPDRDFPATTWRLILAGGMGDPTPTTPANLGYLGFFTAMGFDGNGKLLWVGAWE